MKGDGRFWILVFGNTIRLRWVLANRTMAFRKTAAPRLRAMGKRDRAVLYVSKGAFHNPARDTAHLGGVATVLALPTYDWPVTISGEEFRWTVPIRIDLALPERASPEVRPLVSSLSFVRRPDVWGMYFRSSPQQIPEADFCMLTDTIQQWRSRR